MEALMDRVLRILHPEIGPGDVFTNKNLLGGVAVRIAIHPNRATGRPLYFSTSDRSCGYCARHCASPVSPEMQDDDLPAEIAQPQGVAVDVVPLDVGCGLTQDRRTLCEPNGFRRRPRAQSCRNLATRKRLKPANDRRETAHAFLRSPRIGAEGFTRRSGHCHEQIARNCARRARRENQANRLTQKKIPGRVQSQRTFR